MSTRKLITAASTTKPTEPVASTAPAQENWKLEGKPSTAKNAVAGVGPAPGPKTVGHAALTRIGENGATLKEIQEAIAAVGLKGKHPAKPLLNWLAKERGYSFVCVNGLVKRA